MMNWGHMGGWGNGPGNFAGGFGWYGILGMVLHFIFWIAIIYVVYRMFRSTGFKSVKGQQRQDSNAVEILKVRYAKGEINTEEYNQRKAVLEQSNP